MREVYPSVHGDLVIADIRLIAHKVFVELEEFYLPTVFRPVPMSRKIYRRNLVDIQGFGYYDVPATPFLMRLAVRIADFDSEDEAIDSLNNKVQQPIRFIETETITWPATRWDCLKSVFGLKHRTHDFITGMTYAREYQGDYDDTDSIAEFLRRADFSGEKVKEEK